MTAVSVPVTGGSSALLSQSNAEINFTQKGELTGVRAVYRPNQLRYSVFLGQLRDFEVEFASGSATNRFDVSDGGFVYGIGLSGSFLPSSIASVGIAWDVQFRQSRVQFERFVSAAGTVPSSQDLVEDEIQGAVVASKHFWEISPYLGIKVARRITRLEDGATGEKLRGHNDGASAVAGIEWSPIPGEVGFLEASFFDEESFAAGWGFRF